MRRKHKKTRREKIVADYRHQIYVLKNENIPSDTPAPAIVINENSYFHTHVLKDVRRTGMLTCAIVAAQIILFFLLKNHLITLPMIKY
jgi:hypothetical protein